MTWISPSFGFTRTKKPLLTARVRPNQTSHVPRVVMNEGIRAARVIRPFESPIDVATTSPMRIASHIGRPAVLRRPITMPEKA
jgi:hypothetical protein